jgi:hypothetical protein
VVLGLRGPRGMAGTLDVKGGNLSRRRSNADRDLPPPLVWLINAAKHAGKDAEGADIGGAPEALRGFGALASRALPHYGVFAPNIRISASKSNASRKRIWASTRHGESSGRR